VSTQTIHSQLNPAIPDAENPGKVAVTEWNAQGKCVLWEQDAQQLFRCPAQQALGQHWAQCTRIINEDLALATRRLDQLLTGQIDRAQWVSRHSTDADQPIVCHWHIRPLHGANGRVTGLWATCQNQTNRHQLIQRLATSEKSLEMAQRLASIGIWEFDLRQGKTDWSKQVYELFHRDPALGPPTLQENLAYYTPDSSKHLQQMIERVVQTGQTYEVDLRVPLSDGQHQTHYAVIEPVKDASKRVMGVRGTVQDITSRKLMEASLAESESRFRLLTEHSMDIIALHQPSGEYVYVSPAFETLLGRRRQDVIGVDPYTLIHPDDHKDSVRRVHDELLAGQAPAPVTFRMRHAEGHWIWLESRTGVVKAPSGETTHIVTISRDITERLRMQSEARARELAHLSRLATIGEMSTSIAHEVNQPLAAIAMLAKTFEPDLEAGVVDREGLLQVLKQIRDESLRAGQIIHRVKSMARRRETEYTPQDLRELIEEALATIEPTTRLSGCQVRFSVPNTPCMIKADDVEIKQVALNLLMNAIDTFKEFDCESPRLDIEIHDANDMWRLEVTDNGPGIPENKLHEVFSAFVTTKESGLGLGLSICVNLVENHRGKIWVEHNHPNGAKFNVSLPKIIDVTEDVLITKSG